MSMDSTQLRRTFTDFFVGRGHTLVPSAGLIPTHPTAPLFTNSGMMQFVPYFMGEERVPFKPPRATSVQKCVRAGGKHNDLDAIGRSLRHLSFFEMLGNFSFGDYFKLDAIRWAWELVVDVLGFDGDRLWITVHVTDDEAEEIWVDAVGFPRERIQRLDKANFWEMGEVGPCGPSSELFYDFGPAHGPDGGPANPAAEGRFIEFWNLVFTQYFRHPDGSLSDLSAKNVDTGAGLERMLLVPESTTNFYETDVLLPLVDEAQSLTGVRLGTNPQHDVALRILADHTRTITFLINDGVVPSNEERGSVLRRILRRAVRYADVLGVTRTDVLPRLIDGCIQIMAPAYPDLRDNAGMITRIVSQEEVRFRRTLDRGSVLLDARLSSLRPGQTLSGETAFELYDTHGFPLELTEEIAAERDIGVDLAGYEEAMKRAQETSQKGMRVIDNFSSLTSFQGVLDEFGPSEFVGREELETQATVLAVIGSDVFLDRTPFYAESGGQVGDTGFIETETGLVRVVDTTYALPGLPRHQVEPLSGTIDPGQNARAWIDLERRRAIARNHTGTHILHWSLRQVLGDQVKQQGSLVAPDRLRFDFGPSEALTPEQICEVENLANHEILSDAPVRNFETTRDEASRLGAIAFFGEKYGDRVRVLEAGEHSIELCGGTHVHALGEIGQMKIVKEESIGANLRRVEALTGEALLEYVRAEHDQLSAVAGLLNVSPDEAVDGLTRRLNEFHQLRSEIKSLQLQVALSRAVELAGNAEEGLVVANLGVIERDALRDLALAVRERPGVDAVVLGGTPPQGGAALLAAVRTGSGWRADELLRDATKHIQGGGRLNADIAIAGGRDAAGIDAALDVARQAAAARRVAVAKSDEDVASG
jgi:alanyl-tRNA synthetase